MSFGMLLSPKFQKQWRHCREDHSCPMDLGMATGTKRKHKAHDRLARYPVMNDDRSLVSARSVTDPAAIAVSLQNGLTQAAEILLILPFQRVAGCTQAQSQDLCVSAWAVHHPLNETCHFPAPLFASAALALTARSIVWTETPK
jgi:hypothetical protein